MGQSTVIIREATKSDLIGTLRHQIKFVAYSPRLKFLQVNVYNVPDYGVNTVFYALLYRDVRGSLRLIDSLEYKLDETDDAQRSYDICESLLNRLARLTKRKK
mgnify:CR=1 FL=1